MPQAEYNANPRIITENAIIIVIPCPITHMIFKGTPNDVIRKGSFLMPGFSTAAFGAYFGERSLLESKMGKS